MIELGLKALGALTAALLTIAGAIYLLIRHLRKDGRDDADADLLGRGKSTIFEQYEGIIKRLESEQDRYRAEIDRQAQHITNMSTRLVNHENELIAARKQRSDFAEMLLSVKRQQEFLLESGGLKKPLLEVDTDVFRYQR